MRLRAPATVLAEGAKGGRQLQCNASAWRMFLRSLPGPLPRRGGRAKTMTGTKLVQAARHAQLWAAGDCVLTESEGGRNEAIMEPSEPCV